MYAKDMHVLYTPPIVFSHIVSEHSCLCLPMFYKYSVSTVYISFCLLYSIAIFCFCLLLFSRNIFLKNHYRHESFSDDLKLAVILAKEKDTSSRLTAILIAEHNFFFLKSAFCDTLALRYIWQPVHLSVRCVRP